MMRLLVIIAVGMLAGQVQAGLAMRGLAAIMANQHDWWSSDALESCVAYFRPGITMSSSDYISTNNLTEYGNPTISSDGFLFDNSDYYSSTAFDFGGNTGLTVSAWIKNQPTSGFIPLIAIWDDFSDNECFLFDVYNNDIRFRVSNPADNDYAVTVDNYTNGWHLVTCVYDSGSGIIIYIDGAVPSQSSSGTIPASLLDTDIPLTLNSIIDSRGVLRAYGSGNMDEIAIFTRALTSNQIIAYYVNSYNAEFSTR